MVTGMLLLVRVMPCMSIAMGAERETAPVRVSALPVAGYATPLLAESKTIECPCVDDLVLISYVPTAMNGVFVGACEICSLSSCTRKRMKEECE